jgi:integrase
MANSKNTSTRRYRYIHEDMDRHGNVRIYFWRGKGQPKIRIWERPGTVAFEAEYGRVSEGIFVKKSAPARQGSMAWLCEQYYASPVFKRLDPSTQKQRRRFLDPICARCGERPYKALLPQHVVQFRDEKAAQPDSANALVQAIRSVFGWACEPEYALAISNPALGIKKLAPLKPGGHEPWPLADVAKFCAAYPLGTRERLSLDLFRYTGCRLSDAILFGPPTEENGELVFVEYKGRQKKPKKHYLPILPALRASIDATPTGLKTYLVNSRGEPFKAPTFSLFMRTACRAVGIKAGLSSHGIRKLAAEQCAENGASTKQLMAMFGWVTISMAEHYTRGAELRRLEAEGSRFRVGGALHD